MVNERRLGINNVFITIIDLGLLNFMLIGTDWLIYAIFLSSNRSSNQLNLGIRTITLPSVPIKEMDLQTRTNKPQGLINESFYCYLNTTLQMLFNVPAAAKLIAEKGSSVSQATLNRLPYLRALMAVVDSPPVPDNDSDIDNLISNATEMKQIISPRFPPGEQQDLDEFLTFFLNRLHEELIVSDDNSPVSKIFRGKTLYTNAYSMSDQPFFSLHLDLLKDEVFDVESALLETFKGNTERISSLPEALILHLKRFTFCPEMKTARKIRKLINLQPEITFPDAVLLNKDEVGNNSYSLCSVGYHVGDSASNGHYVAECYNETSGKWYRCDDETVTEQSPSWQTSSISSPMTPYVLLYTRRESFRKDETYPSTISEYLSSVGYHLDDSASKGHNVAECYNETRDKEYRSDDETDKCSIAQTSSVLPITRPLPLLSQSRDSSGVSNTHRKRIVEDETYPTQTDKLSVWKKSLIFKDKSSYLTEVIRRFLNLSKKQKFYLILISIFCYGIYRMVVFR